LVLFYLVKRGDRIAQLICEKIEMVDLVEEEVYDQFNISFDLVFVS